ncbi:MAG: hypothetical protein K8R21_08215 [Leptospira sp.]|nr:hypothetical protein [Leptospira sp.]
MALKKHISVLLFLIITLTNFPVYSWGTHYLVMARSLEHPSMNYTLRKVPVESIEKFIVSEKDGLDKVFSGYYEWMAKRGSTRFNKMIFDPKKPDLTSFLKAARLNPVTKYPLVNRILPGSKPVYRRVSGGEVSPYLKENKSGFFIEFEDVTGKEVSIRSILTTFVDEPDWNMDHHLWKIQEYGYGKQPYGKDEGESSKAPFHMQFLHENIIVRTFAPEIAKGGMMLDRIELFKRLADLAIKTNHPYWAYRFTAWATHYIQGKQTFFI